MNGPFGNFIGSASVPEILWIVAAIDLFIVSRRNHIEALADRIALKDVQNGRRKLVESNLFVARMFMGIGAVKVGIGTFAALTPARVEPSLSGMLVVLVLLALLVAADLALRSMRNFRLYVNEHGMQARDSDGKFVKEK